MSDSHLPLDEHNRPTVPESRVPRPGPLPIGEPDSRGESTERPRVFTGSLIGETIDGYSVIGQLGEGGFGSVYLAEQSHPVRRRVAMKVIKPGMDSRAVLARFEAERQALAMMDHPGVAKVFDAGVTPPNLGSRPYFVMELVKGVHITAFCRDERVGVRERIGLMMQVCAAVQHAHVKGVIHRDLKPSNILVELIDGAPTVKIIDFGVAKALNQRLSDSTVYTERGQMIGTLEYMAPEQARGSAVDADTRADVYSLGAILYELLTGLTPLDGKALRAAGYREAQRMIEEETPVAPSMRVSRLQTAAESPADDGGETGSTIPGGGNTATLSRWLRGELDWIVMRCLDKERARRYDSAGALARDLERFLRDEPVEAGPPSRVYRLSKFIRRHRVGVATTAAVAVALGAAVIGTSWGLTKALKEQDRAEKHADAEKKAREEAEAVTAFLSEMLDSVDAREVGGGRDVLVRTVLDRAAAKIGPSMAGTPLVEARLRQTIGNSYRALGLLDQADAHLPPALEIRRRELGDDHPDTILVLGNVAGLRQEQGRYAEAETMGLRAIEAWNRIGRGDTRTAIGLMNNIAMTYVRQGRLSEALPLQRRAVEASTRALGPDHPDTLGLMTNLAVMTEASNDSEQAEAMLVRAIEGFERAKMPTHPALLLARQSLGMLYRNTGRADKAEPLLRSVLEDRTRLLGPEHPDTARAMGNLAHVLFKLDKAEDARSLGEQAWDLSVRALGETHADTLTIALNLMSVYESLGWPAESADRCRGLVRALRAVIARPGATAEQFNSCAWMLLTLKPESLRDDKAALDGAQKACEMERARAGGDLWQYLDTLALAQFRIGDAASAAKSQSEAIGLVPKAGESFLPEMKERLKEYEAAAAGAGK